MAIPENYIDRITDIENGDRRYICPAADKVRVDNDNFEGTDLDAVLDEIADAIDDACEGGYAPPAGGIPATDLAPAVQTSLGKADTAYQKPASGIPATDIADGVIPDTANLATKTEVNTGLAGKVDKVTGYGLSKNDYTDADKAAVGTIGSKANDNVVVKSISVNGGEAQTPTHGNVNINVQAGSQVDPATSSPSMDGTAAVGTSAKYAREDHVHPHDTSKQDALTFDNAPTAGSNNPVKSGGIKDAIDAVIPTIDPTTKKWIVGGVLTDVFAEGQDGNSGVASADGVESVNNLNGGTEDTPTKVYVLGANQGKVLADMIGTCYKKTGGMTTQKVYGALGISQGSRSIGTGWQLNQSSSNRAYSLLMEADGSDIKVYENNSTTNVSYILEGYISDDTVKVVCPAGYRVFGMIGDQLASTTSTSHYKEFPSVSNINGTSDLDVEIDLTVGGTISVSQFKYFTIGFAKSGDGSITGTDIATLQSSAKVFYEEEVAADGGHVAFEIVDKNGTVLKSVSSTNDNNNVTMYSKSAVDELLSGIGDTDVSGYYRKANSSEAPSVITFDNIVSGSQRQPGAGIGTAAYNAKRLCVNEVFDMQDASNPFNIVRLYIPDGYLGGVTQCKVTTATSASGDYVINNFASGLIDVNLDPAYRYVTINFKRADDASTSATDVAALENAVYALSAEPQTTTKSIEIIGADGKSVKNIYNEEDGDTVQVASKAYVDKFAYGNTLRVLAWNIGHFANGASHSPSINDSNYDEKLKQWKGSLNRSCANILLLPEFDPTFGSHTVDGSTVSENSVDVVFNPLFPYASVGTKNAYSCNAIISKKVLGGGSTVNYTSQGQLMYYRMDTIVVGGKTVKLVATHLDWTQNETYATYRAAQIQQLITTFKNEPYVIIGGDFNIDATSEWDTFVENGFSIVNHGDLGDIFTYPASGANEFYPAIASRPFPDKALDNIIFKGFKVSNIALVDEGVLTDHCGIMCDLTII